MVFVLGYQVVLNVCCFNIKLGLFCMFQTSLDLYICQNRSTPVVLAVLRFMANSLSLFYSK